MYFIIPNKNLAEDLIKRIDSVMCKEEGYKTWELIENLTVHPLTNEYVVLYKELLKPHKHLFSNYKSISKADAIEKGWYFDFHKGRYGKLLSNLEETQYIFSELKNSYGVKPFQFQKSFILSFAYSCYTIKETIRFLSSKKIKGVINENTSTEQEKWWQDKWSNEIDVDDTILKYFYEFHNSTKHSTTMFLMPKATYFYPNGSGLEFTENQFLQTEDGKILIGAEGYFEIDKCQTIPSRTHMPDYNMLKIRYGITGVMFDYEFLGLPNKHLGKSITFSNSLEIIELIFDYYKNLILEVITRFP